MRGIVYALLFTTTLSAEVYRRYIETEHCEGIQFFSYDNEQVKGWYARESMAITKKES